MRSGLQWRNPLQAVFPNDTDATFHTYCTQTVSTAAGQMAKLEAPG